MDPVAQRIMGIVARISISTIMLAHVEATRSLVARYADYLEPSHLAAIEDHMKAMKRLGDSLSATTEDDEGSP
jgi:hypothetical protein